MKIKYLIFSIVVFVGIVAASCNNQQPPAAKKEAEQSEEIYACSMHPQVHENHPGNCSICGMQLIKKNTKPAETTGIELESLLKPSNEFVVTSIPTVTVREKNIDTTTKAYGVIEYDTRAAATVSSRVSGRVEKMYIRYRFQPVSKGQKIMEIYSPELLTAQQNLLFLLRSDASNTSFIQAAKEKLLLLGMSEKELAYVIQTAKPLMSIGVYSNYEGHVHDAGMLHNDGNTTEMKTNTSVTSELSLKEGMYVQKGETLLMVMNHHEVWAALQIFPADQVRIKKGSRVTIIPETDTSAVINGQINFIEPFFRENSKTVTARVYFRNMSMLPIGSHLQANIKVSNKSGKWLPQTAVISLGINKVVFLKKENGFIAHKIITGINSGNEIQIISGLLKGDSVIADASYLIDSENFIKTASK